MANDTLLNTSTVSFSDIIGNGKLYKVPLYQRDYSWKKEHWEDLWNDILTIVRYDTVHYMGAVVFQNRGNKTYSVIDGQQRLVTLSLVVLATLHHIRSLIEQKVEVAENEERMLLLSKKFLGDKDPGSLTYSAKLELNENNNGFYQSHLMIFRTPINTRKLRDSDALLWKGYHFFVDKIGHYFGDKPSGEGMANFLNKEIAEKLKFIQIVVEDEVNAYTVFETLNSRGERLTISDLLKNFLFSRCSTTDLPHVKEQWQRIIDTVGLEKFPTFLRHYWISKHPLINERDLFKALKMNINDAISAIDLLDELERNAQLYVALKNYHDELWQGKREIQKRIR
ncbi:MAG: DUF262 domain-containing protein, partial [Spirosomaceae bacterium]|nr:DUF262 domain-containing protein [Spirosomataceae bacterium]